MVPIVLRDRVRTGPQEERFVSVPETSDVLVVAKPAERDQAVILRYQNLRKERQAVPTTLILLKDYERGLPDGSCMDAEGYLWNCRVVGGSCLVRLDGLGKIDRVIELPCSWPTSCAFGGAALDTLYVTSARFTMAPAT